MYEHEDSVHEASEWRDSNFYIVYDDEYNGGMTVFFDLDGKLDRRAIEELGRKGQDALIIGYIERDGEVSYIVTGPSGLASGEVLKEAKTLNEVKNFVADTIIHNQGFTMERYKKTKEMRKKIDRVAEQEGLPSSKSRTFDEIDNDER